MTIPFYLNVPVFLKEWWPWVEFRKKLHKASAQDIMFDRTLANFPTDAEIAAAMVRQSLRHGWRGIFPVRDGKIATEFKKAGTVWEATVSLPAVQARLRAIKADNNNWVLKLADEPQALVDHLIANKPEGWEGRVKEIKQSYRNYVRMGLKPALQEEYDDLLRQKSRHEQNLTRGTVNNES